MLTWRHFKWGLTSKLLMRALSCRPWIPGTLKLDSILFLFKCALPLAENLREGGVKFAHVSRGCIRPPSPRTHCASARLRGNRDLGQARQPQSLPIVQEGPSQEYLGYEHIELPTTEEEKLYGTEQCPCTCHPPREGGGEASSAPPVANPHCIHCSIRVRYSALAHKKAMQKCMRRLAL